MKRKILISCLILLMLVVTGCGKKEEDWKPLVAGWETDLTDKQVSVDEDIKKVFDKAVKSYEDDELEMVALLGKQVVAGTNYMFLCKNENVYKIVIIYNDLENKSTVTSVKDFNYSKYTNEDISYKNEDIVGGWYTDIPDKETKLDDKVQAIYDKAITKIQGAQYYPIAVLGHQIVSGTNYAVLAYGKMNTAEKNSGIYLLTLYEDLNGTDEIVSSAYIDLGEFNK